MGSANGGLNVASLTYQLGNKQISPTSNVTIGALGTWNLGSSTETLGGTLTINNELGYAGSVTGSGGTLSLLGTTPTITTIAVGLGSSATINSPQASIAPSLNLGGLRRTFNVGTAGNESNSLQIDGKITGGELDKQAPAR